MGEGVFSFVFCFITTTIGKFTLFVVRGISNNRATRKREIKTRKQGSKTIPVVDLADKTN